MQAVGWLKAPRFNARNRSRKTPVSSAGLNCQPAHPYILAADGTPISVSTVGIGTLQWGDETCGYGKAVKVDVNLTPR